MRNCIRTEAGLLRTNNKQGVRASWLKTAVMKRMNDLSDEYLMAHVTSGDLAAYRELYGRYASAVMGVSYRIVRDSGVAEEVTQETFWRVWNNASSFDRERGTFTNWMFGIARNLSIDVVRRRAKVRLESLGGSQSEDAPPRQFRSEHDVADTAWTMLKHEQVHAALLQLPEEQRDVVEWIYFQGKTRREIAEEQGIPFGTINTRAKLALQKLRRALEVNGYFEE